MAHKLRIPGSSSSQLYTLSLFKISILIVLKWGQMPTATLSPNHTSSLPILVYPSLHCWLLAAPTDLLAQLLPRLPQGTLGKALLVYPRQQQLVREEKEIVRNGLFLQHRLIWKSMYLSIGLYTLRSRLFICLHSRRTINALLNMNKGS